MTQSLLPTERKTIAQRATTTLNFFLLRLRTLTRPLVLLILPTVLGVRLIQRQQGIYRALGDLMTGPVHAFTMRTLTPSEAAAKGIKMGADQEQKQPNQGGLKATSTRHQSGIEANSKRIKAKWRQIRRDLISKSI